MNLCIHLIVRAVFTFIAQKCLNTCTEAVEHRLISVGRGRDRGESSDQILEVYDLGCDTTAVLRLLYIFLVALKRERALRNGHR
jgi:hypothetical protein